MAMQPMQPMPPAAFMAMQAMPAEAFQSMQQSGMHPEMMQGMQAMPMQMVMGPMGPMMAGPMPPGMVMAPGAMAAPQLTQMLVDAARGGRSSNVFFKTRICNKWRAGSCPYGDKCTYAHGEHELRYVPPEVVAQLEAQQKLQESMQQRQGATPDGQQQRGEEGPVGSYSHSAAGGAPPGGVGHQSFYKTRLCIKYMQTGYCHKAAACTFAHGYEDLRQPGTPLSPGRAPPTQDPMSPGRMGMAPGAMGMMPAAMMGMGMPPPPGAVGGGRGMGMAATAAMPMTMPMAMPAAAMGQRYPGQQQQRSPRGGATYGGGRDDAATAARRRAAAMCSIAGVGEAGADAPPPAALQAAMVDVRSGAAYHESAYADSVADYVGQPAQGGARHAHP